MMGVAGVEIGNLPNLIVLIFGCLIWGVSLGMLFFFVAKADASISHFHQKLAILIFSVTVTVMVVLLGALPETQKRVNEVAGNIGALTFNIAGPAAVWAAVFLITTHVFASKTGAASDERNKLVINEALERHYRMLGFDYYRTWYVNLNAFRRVIEKSELHFIDDLLPKVFYHGPYGLLKPRRVVNSTLFVFSKGRAVKLQRIQGSVRTEGEKRSRVYLPHTPSTPGGQISCLHFIRGENGIAQTACHTHGDWKEAPLNNIDILLVAVYENDELEGGDYVYVDVSKYIDLERMDDAAVELAVVSDRLIEEYNVWEVSASLASTEKPVPLMFRNLHGQTGRRTAAEADKNRERIAKMFDGWGGAMDRAQAGGLGQATGVSRDEVLDFLLKVKAILSDGDADASTFQQIFRKLPAEDCVFSRLPHQRNVILSTFAWDESGAGRGRP
jgi:hypothetical protein